MDLQQWWLSPLPFTSGSVQDTTATDIITTGAGGIVTDMGMDMATDRDGTADMGMGMDTAMGMGMDGISK